MTTPLRALIVEDSELDAELLVRELRGGGFDVVFERVDTAEAMKGALAIREWDVVFSDYSMPRFDPGSAMAVLRDNGLDLPFIIVSGTVGEDTAVEAMRAGAQDYFRKDRLSPRLIPAVERELREAAGRAARRRAERALRESEASYRQLVDSLRAIVWRADAKTFRFTFVSPEAENILGYPLAAWLAGETFWVDHIHPEDRERVVALCRKNTQEGRDHQFEYRMVSADGRAVWLQDVVRIVSEEGAPAELVGVMVDVSEQRRAEEEVLRQRESLHQSEKLAAMGTLLAGVAHELNNPLAVVLGQASLLRRGAGEGPLATRADKITQAAERCGRIVGNFLALARQRPPERRRVALNSVVQEAVELLAYSLNVDNVELRLELAPGLPSLWADPHQLHQVVLNLMTNAHQAVRGGSPPWRITLWTRLEGRSVVLEVTDNGPGISSENQARVFDPFFTTKRPGEGTGLGLSLCLGIVEGHGGTIQVESEPGRGTTFRVALPAPDDPAAVEVSAAPGDARGGAGRSILVVDDEAAVAEMLADLLAEEGHRVTTARNGVAALEKLAGGSFDVIFSDIKMPLLDGPGLYREVQRRHPQMADRFVFMTGDSLSAETDAFLQESGRPSVEKPASLEDFQGAILRVAPRG